jgi:quercetin dioxygenase-like cupin family protein
MTRGLGGSAGAVRRRAEPAILAPRAGWQGRFFHSEHMTFVYYAIAAGAHVRVQYHDQEEVWHLLEGELEISLSGVTHRPEAGQAAVVPAGEHHSVRALHDSRVIVVDHPVRTSVGGLDTGAPGGA